MYSLYLGLKISTYSTHTKIYEIRKQKIYETMNETKMNESCETLIAEDVTAITNGNNANTEENESHIETLPPCSKDKDTG